MELIDRAITRADQLVLLSWSYDGSVHLWEATTGERLGSLLQGNNRRNVFRKSQWNVYINLDLHRKREAEFLVHALSPDQNRRIRHRHHNHMVPIDDEKDMKLSLPTPVPGGASTGKGNIAGSQTPGRDSGRHHHVTGGSGIRGRSGSVAKDNAEADAKIAGLLAAPSATGHTHSRTTIATHAAHEDNLSSPSRASHTSHVEESPERTFMTRPSGTTSTTAAGVGGGSGTSTPKRSGPLQAGLRGSSRMSESQSAHELIQLRGGDKKGSVGTSTMAAMNKSQSTSVLPPAMGATSNEAAAQTLDAALSAAEVAMEGGMAAPALNISAVYSALVFSAASGQSAPLAPAPTVVPAGAYSSPTIAIAGATTAKSAASSVASIVAAAREHHHRTAINSHSYAQQQQPRITHGAAVAAARAQAHAEDRALAEAEEEVARLKREKAAEIAARNQGQGHKRNQSMARGRLGMHAHHASNTGLTGSTATLDASAFWGASHDLFLPTSVTHSPPSSAATAAATTTTTNSGVGPGDEKERPPTTTSLQRGGPSSPTSPTRGRNGFGHQRHASSLEVTRRLAPTNKAMFTFVDNSTAKVSSPSSIPVTPKLSSHDISPMPLTPNDGMSSSGVTFAPTVAISTGNTLTIAPLLSPGVSPGGSLSSSSSPSGGGSGRPGSTHSTRSNGHVRSPSSAIRLGNKTIVVSENERKAVERFNSIMEQVEFSQDYRQAQ
jgi:hypothetical protein